MPFAVRPRFCWKLRSRTLNLGPRTLVMGILNVTPDSFSDGGTFFRTEDALTQALAMLDQGAHILDVGGESTRPNASPLTAAEEQARVLSVIRAILELRPEATLSIDTYHASTARLAVHAGAEIVNDVSGGLWDAAMLPTCAELGCGVILMHTRGRPHEWAALPPLAAEDVLPLVRDGLARRGADAIAAGIGQERIVLDPGFGFGKIDSENGALLARFDGLVDLGFPLLAGLSRKRFLARALAPLHTGQPPAAAEHRLHATIAANTAAVLAGAHIVRVHDVLPALEAAAIADTLLHTQP